MPHWIRLITFTDEGLALVSQEQGGVLTNMSAIIAKKGGRLLAAFATLGPFDVLSIVEASDENQMDMIDQALEGEGLYTAQTIAAIPVVEFMATVKKSPIFLQSWLDGRRQQNVERDPRALEASRTVAAAASAQKPPGQRFRPR